MQFDKFCILVSDLSDIPSGSINFLLHFLSFKGETQAKTIQDSTSTFLFEFYG